MLGPRDGAYTCTGLQSRTMVGATLVVAR